MKKILYVCPSTGIGGAETFIKQSFRHSNGAEFKNYYLLFRTGPLFDELKKMGAHVTLLAEPPRLSRFESHKRVTEKIRQMINELNIDLVHSTMSYGAIFSSRAAKQMRVPHVWFQHGPVDGFMDRYASVLSHDGLIVNSHYTSSEQRALENPFRFLVPRKFPIEKILLGTDLERPEEDVVKQARDKLRRDHSLTTETLLIGMLCRIQKWKGVHVLLDAITELRKKDISRFHCFIWGGVFKEEDYFSSLKKQVADNSLPVSFMGETHEVAKNLSAIDVIVNASINPEPFGLSIIEGMMMGAIPVIADQGGPQEIVKHGKDGLHFSLGDPSSLAQQLTKLIADPELRQKVSQEARQSAERKFRAERAIGQMEDFYKKILQ